MSATGWPDGGPTRSGCAMGDVLGGLSCAVGVLAARTNKLKTGEGEMVDVALVDSVVSSLEIVTQIYLSSGRIPSRIGNRYETLYPYDSFHTSDGDIVIGCGNDKLFHLLATEMGREQLTKDPRFLRNCDRVENHAALKEIIEQWFTTYTMDELVERLNAIGVPAGPINTIDRVVAGPSISGAREMSVEVKHPTAGKMKLTGNQIKFTELPTSIRTPAPILGQHNNEIFGTLIGLDHETIKKYM